MNKYQQYIGIDVSAVTLDIGIFNPEAENEKSVERFSNDIEGFEKAEIWLKSKGISTTNTVICLEITGVYSEEICYYLHDKGYIIWAEAPHKVSRAFRGMIKNDTVAALQIGEYCCRFLDLMKPFEPNISIVDQVQSLLTTREQLVAQRTSNKNVLAAFERKHYKSKIAINALETTIKSLNESIKEIEKELKKLIYNNPQYANKAQAIDSVPGISLLFVSNFFVVTKGFSNAVSYKNLASYLGICPNEFKSGTSVYKKPKSSGFGNDRLRKLLYLASMSVKQHFAKFSNYFDLKVKQGKNHVLILNNIANRLIKLVCAVSKSGLKFNPLYESINPKFLKVI
jgi:transposase